MVGFFNAVVTWFFDLLLWPFENVAPVWGLLFVSALSGILLALVYGRVSNQAAIRRTKQKIGSLMLEAVLYRRDLAVSLCAQARMFGQAFVYLGHALPPLAILMIPSLIILAQLNLRYNARGLKPGERTLLSLKLDKPLDLKGVTLRSSGGLLLSPPVRVPQSKEIFWRIEPVVSGMQSVTIEVEDKSVPRVRKAIYDSHFRGKLSSGRYKAWWMNLLYPGDRPFPHECVFSELYIKYPGVHYRFLGIEMHWLVIFALVSILAGVTAAKVFKVEI